MREIPGLHAIKAFSSLVILLVATGTASTAALAQEDTAKPPKLFETEEPLEITLGAPWQDLVRNDTYKGTYPATIEYRDASGNLVQHQLTVERRGVKRQEACDFPPIKWRFEKGEVKGTMFRGQKSIKMVTHCKRAAHFENYYRLEMAAYRMYNLLTDYSFKVRPLKVDYKDSKTGKTDEGRFAFIIEDDSDVAKRNDLEKLVLPRVRSTRLDQQVISTFALFQLLIGNLDWSALKGPGSEECCHNVKVIGPEPLKDTDPIVPVPYDFDSAGLVNAPYVGPPQGLGVRSITQRLYRGFCSHNHSLPEARALIIENETAILDTIRSDELLSKNSHKKALKFLKKYFEMLRDDDDFNKQVIMKCRK